MGSEPVKIFHMSVTNNMIDSEIGKINCKANLACISSGLKNSMASTNQVPLDPSSSIEIVWDFEMWKCFLLNVAWGKPFEIGV